MSFFLGVFMFVVVVVVVDTKRLARQQKHKNTQEKRHFIPILA